MRAVLVVSGYVISSSTLSIINKWALVSGLGARGLQLMQFVFSAVVALCVGAAGLDAHLAIVVHLELRRCKPNSHLLSNRAIGCP